MGTQDHRMRKKGTHYTTGKGDYTIKHVEDAVKIVLELTTTNQLLLFYRQEKKKQLNR